jgi:hypothetical protein
MQFFEVCKIRDTKFPFDGIIVEVTEQLFQTHGEKEMAMQGYGRIHSNLGFIIGY